MCVCVCVCVNKKGGKQCGATVVGCSAVRCQPGISCYRVSSRAASLKAGPSSVAISPLLPSRLLSVSVGAYILSGSTWIFFPACDEKGGSMGGLVGGWVGLGLGRDGTKRNGLGFSTNLFTLLLLLLLLL